MCQNKEVHDCIKDLLRNALTPEAVASPPPTQTTDVIIHQATCDNNDDDDDQLNGVGSETNSKESAPPTRNSSLRSSLKLSNSMETILEKNLSRLKEKSPVESKAKSVGQLNDDEEYLENGESIELIFISDEFVNKVQKQEQKMIILDDKTNIKRRDSLNNKQKIVIITDEYKNKVLRNN